MAAVRLKERYVAVLRPTASLGETINRRGGSPSIKSICLAAGQVVSVADRPSGL